MKKSDQQSQLERNPVWQHLYAEGNRKPYARVRPTFTVAGLDGLFGAGSVREAVRLSRSLPPGASAVTVTAYRKGADFVPAPEQLEPTDEVVMRFPGA